MTSSMPWLSPSTRGLVRRSVGRHPRKHSTISHNLHDRLVLRQPLEPKEDAPVPMENGDWVTPCCAFRQLIGLLSRLDR